MKARRISSWIARLRALLQVPTTRTSGRRGVVPANTDQLSAIDIVSPTFYVPDEVDVTTGHEYLLTASAENAVDGTVEVTVTVLNRGPLSVVCTYPGSIYEGSADFELDCSASGAPTGSNYTYVWTARGSTANTDQLSAADISSPTFYVPEEVDENGRDVRISADGLGGQCGRRIGRDDGECA